MKKTVERIIPVDVEQLGCPVLACPVCGQIYVHPIGLDCRSPGTEKGHVHIDARGIAIDPRAEPVERGVCIILTFICESGHNFEYQMQFHKGVTLLTRRINQIATGLSRYDTIWRD